MLTWRADSTKNEKTSNKRSSTNSLTSLITGLNNLKHTANDQSVENAKKT